MQPTVINVFSLYSSYGIINDTLIKKTPLHQVLHPIICSYLICSDFEEEWKQIEVKSILSRCFSRGPSSKLMSIAVSIGDISQATFAIQFGIQPNISIIDLGNLLSKRQYRFINFIFAQMKYFAKSSIHFGEICRAFPFSSDDSSLTGARIFLKNAPGYCRHELREFFAWARKNNCDAALTCFQNYTNNCTCAATQNYAVDMHDTMNAQSKASIFEAFKQLTYPML